MLEERVLGRRRPRAAPLGPLVELDAAPADAVQPRARREAPAAGTAPAVALSAAESALDTGSSQPGQTAHTSSHDQRQNQQASTSETGRQETAESLEEEERGSACRADATQNALMRTESARLDVAGHCRPLDRIYLPGPHHEFA